MLRLFFLFLLLFLGCGYKPSTTYQNKILGNSIKPVVEIDIKNPRETIFLKDALNDAIYTLLGKNISFNNYDTIIKINPNSSSLSVLDYDENGFPYLYRSKVVLKVEIIDKNKKKYNYTVTGVYDFTVSNNSVVTDQTKLEAYKKASINALNKLLAQITKNGIKK